MKKNIFLILVSSLFILVLFYFYDEKGSIVNKEYSDYDKNIFIHYPYFNNDVIDNYINDYLNSFMELDNDLIELLFIYYDYLELENKIELMLYLYLFDENPLI